MTTFFTMKIMSADCLDSELMSEHQCMVISSLTYGLQEKRQYIFSKR